MWKLYSVEVLAPLSTTSDHCTIKFLLLYKNIISQNCNILQLLCYAKGYYATINMKRSKILWFVVFNMFNYNIQSIYDFFLHKIHLLMDKYIPIHRFKQKISHPRHLNRIAKDKK